MANIAQLLTEHMDIWTGAETEKKSSRGRASGNGSSVYGVKKLRELILELAVRGKLVPQDPNDEPASELLKRIQAEKARLMKEGKLKKEKPLPPITDEEKPFELPQGWDYASFGDVVEIIRGITFPGSEKTKAPEPGRIACLRTTNVQDQIEWDDILYIREQFISRNDQILLPNDIVMSMANSRELVGKVALVGEEIKFRTTFGGFLGVIRPYLILPKFVLALLRTPHTREKLIDNASQTTNIANISLAKLKPLFFAIPPIAEQHRIVAKVDELMALCDQLEQQHSNAQEAHETLVSQLLATLTQSQNATDFNANWQRIYAHFDLLFTTEASIDVLKQTLLQLAVMGKLVPQDPDDEPASELLKRIQNEKAKPLAPIGEDEKPFELPTGWLFERFGEYLDFQGGGQPPKDVFVEQPQDGYVQLIQIRDLGENPQPVYIPIELASKFCTTDDIMVGRYGASVGKVFWGKDGSYNVALVKIIDDFNLYSKRFLFEFLRSPQGQSFFSGMSRSAQAGFNKGDIELKIVPIPPLAEQHRIVAKVDAFMALCDQLKTRLQQAGQQQQAIADALVAQAVA